VAVFEKRLREMAADETGATGDEYVHTGTAGGDA
jgi:hypothetical protein